MSERKQSIFNCCEWITPILLHSQHCNWWWRQHWIDANIINVLPNTSNSIETKYTLNRIKCTQVIHFDNEFYFDLVTLLPTETDFSLRRLLHQEGNAVDACISNSFNKIYGLWNVSFCLIPFEWNLIMLRFRCSYVDCPTEYAERHNFMQRYHQCKCRIRYSREYFQRNAFRTSEHNYINTSKHLSYQPTHQPLMTNALARSKWNLLKPFWE